MARRESATKKGTVKMGRAAAAALNIRSYGEEPQYDGLPMSKHMAGTAFSWYSKNIKHDVAKSYLVTWLDHIDDPAAEEIRKIPSTIVLGSGRKACWVARMLFMGAEFADPDDEDIKPELDAILGKYREITEKNQGRKAALEKKKVETYRKIVRDRTSGQIIWQADVPVGTEIADRMSLSEALALAAKFDKQKGIHPLARKKLQDHIEVMTAMDDAVDISNPKKIDQGFDLYAAMKEGRVHKAYVDDYTEHLDELSSELDSMDDESVIRRDDLGYTFHQIKMKKELIQRMFQAAQYYREDSKRDADRPKRVVVRKKKVLSPDKMVSRMRYQKEYPEFGLKSIDPKKVLGATELWLYNTKYSVIQVYRAASSEGLGIKGTTLLNYDTTTSTGKRCGRHADEHTSTILTAGKLQLRKFMDTISAAEIEPNGRINENIILLRVL